jgi:hypothetical protein
LKAWITTFIVVGALMVGGAVLMVLEALQMDTSVPVGYWGQRVHNLALAHQQTMWLILGLFTGLIGVGLLVAGIIMDHLRRRA